MDSPWTTQQAFRRTGCRSFIRTATGGVETIQSSSWSHDGDQRDGVPHPGTADCLGEPAPVWRPSVKAGASWSTRTKK
ncbi:uncharacterized protein LOC143673273 isoform X5 [Tamandua tetradactyla]|uniref:uncharacterized protein LOC143673273 isoform X5 n=1 Tax=Tamandua tetradactyla TaxID=48850 RepID=UPI0040543839